ncbi:MAG: nucleotidyltransferase family protein [Clostridiales bacterium]|nr:nucleotidyltransferase family protein [Clostridiales bacterium]
MVEIQSFLYNNIGTILEQKSVDYSVLTIEEQYNFFEMTRAHEIHLLVYDSFKNSDMDHFDESLLNEWKALYLQSTMGHLYKIKNIRTLFDSFKENDIEVMLLKGISYSRYYKNPSSRRMGDIDIYVKEKQIDMACEVLESYGYIQQLSTRKSHHLVFFCEGQLLVELHTEFVDQERFPDIYDMRYQIFEDSYPIDYEGLSFISPTIEYEFLYCMLHMYKHYCYVGFGLKQICDLYYIISRNELNWAFILTKLTEYKMTNFSNVVFKILREDFSLTLPDIIKKSLGKVDTEIVELLKNDVFLSGPFGFFDKSKFLSNQIADHTLKTSKSFISKKLSFLFPSREHLAGITRYKYCRKTVLFLPIAWIHRIVSNLLRQNISISNNYVDNEFINKRIKLKKWVTEK